MSDFINKKALYEEIQSLKITLGNKEIFDAEAKKTILKIIDEYPVIKLDKEIPQKPELTAYGCDKNGNDIYDEWTCPECRAWFDVETERFSYCPECGQKIDWSGYNDL